MVGGQIAALERRPLSTIEPIRKEQAVGRGVFPSIDPAEGEARLAGGWHFARIGGRIENGPRSIRLRLGMIQGQTPRGTRPQPALAVLKNAVGDHGGQSLFSLMADPAPVLEAVDARGGSHPQSAVARGGQLPDPVQLVANRDPGFAVVLQNPVPAASPEFARGQAPKNEYAGFVVTLGGLGRVWEKNGAIKGRPPGRYG